MLLLQQLHSDLNLYFADSSIFDNYISRISVNLDGNHWRQQYKIEKPTDS